MEFVATSMPGIAPLLADELSALGITVTETGKAHVEFSGGTADALRVCLWSRLAERVLLPLATLGVTPDIAPEKLAASQDWLSLVGNGAPIHVNVEHGAGVRGDNRISAKRFIQALPPQFAISRDLRGSCCIRARLDQNEAHLWLDLAGDPLHRRGYRLAGGRAPLRETLAAAMLWAAGWHKADRPGAMLDPFCGSGTLLIEAAWMAAGRAPGQQRRHYGFQHWRGCRRQLWQAAMDEAAASADRPVPALSLKGFDADLKAIQLAQQNAERAGVRSAIHFERRELGALRPRDVAEAGVMVTNPPWGERLDEQDQAGWLHLGLGRMMARLAPGWQVILLGADAQVMDRSGMNLESQWRLKNGPFNNFIRLYTPRPQQPAQVVQVADSVAFDVPEQAMPLVNRLKKNGKHLRRWLEREDIQCYRLYDRDLPEFNVAVDIYGDQVLVQEFKAPKTVDPEKARERRDLAVTAVRAALGVHREQVHLRTRERQKGKQQYQKLDGQGHYRPVREGQSQLLVNLQDYLDTGLFLDHRPIRLRIAEQASGKRFLNLFAYTGSATVHAAVGGAKRTVTVDASKKYLEWAASNLALNGFSTDQHALERADTMRWLDECKEQFDLVFCDPPTFSNNKSRSDFVVEEHHGDLIRKIMRRLEPGGVLYFSCNYRRFKLDESITKWYDVEDLTRWSIPEDFRRNDKIHVLYAIRHVEEP
ncbi:MAG: bifunctional 23S rRNA (guanine(2069)-N(7))-methyltransferase RlmK/23S rRNA (guanine(2445)-N(2))-methyltransferase RlmL [Pseudomonadota bacterium]|uniref:bifunctional 23S rRNA (guanine(2069)-N(7))-methyltransferase RlmK/23S rRNA (guanine(2445)-N(2))-methyltransferase RlmL n=1 Tax=Alcanivorax sp. TaxID=1872427 RepID=UPI0025BD42B6|nr:bifunctional 23S rRNA (guanine(2069)-N(7))-methyltransferase RlmK/23S rRNA (guanine(2445)-N(2))-methyltransferase RlmL [Alcanivorax sp.]MED5240293.1 bifunctional 23S rRNA (guanine(2069)-N(7))-methyltransferase RlmK/23S rRNA (guanine(2445)-N(2))-methyltransferase RlmL [Pseudomonadota bacterium]MEE3319449.1 bifunctional 23S rRNA (guanine(2069)-N(7))-methyltransferase RlmK/23S rRNA (guanine(2445)-N(2))-methyltransferase RlmL [Pseudomonadota bacterium]